MVTYKEFYVQEEMRKVRMAQAEQARMVKVAKSQGKSSSKKKRPHLGLLAAATRLVKVADDLRARENDLSMASREQSSQSNL